MSTLVVYGGKSDVQMRDDKTEVKLLVLPETKKGTALLVNMLKCLSIALALVAEGTPNSSFLCLCRRGPLCRYVQVRWYVDGFTIMPGALCFYF